MSTGFNDGLNESLQRPLPIGARAGLFLDDSATARPERIQGWATSPAAEESLQDISYLDRLRNLVEEKSLLKHPLYLRWQEGQLTMEELKGYAKEYYVIEKEFSRYLSAIHSRCEQPEMRKALLENLVHEEYGNVTHADLWLKFAEGMGVAPENVRSHIHSDETENLLRIFRKHAFHGSVVCGLSALYSYEKQQPKVAEKKIEGLKAFYNVREQSTVAFFEAHQYYDVRHAETEEACLSELCHDSRTQEQSLEAARETLDGLYEFLTGVERRYRPGNVGQA